MLDEGRDVYCYFKHEGGGVGPAYATALLEITTRSVVSGGRQTSRS